MKHARCLAIALMGVCFALTFAQTVVTNNLNPKDTTGLTGFTTTGAMMNGMTVRVTYGDGSFDTAVWGQDGPTSGSASAVGLWTLSLTGDSLP